MSEITRLCKIVFEKISQKTNEKDSLNVINDLQKILKLLFKDAQNNPPPEYTQKLSNALLRLCDFSEVRAVQAGFSQKVKLLILDFLQIIGGNFEFSLEANKPQHCFYAGSLQLRLCNGTLQNIFLTTLRNSNFSVSKSLLFLPRLLNQTNVNLTFEDGNTISQSLFQFLICQKSRKGMKKSSLAYELDNSASCDIFTVLNYVQHYNHAFVMNVYTFAVLKEWLRFVISKEDIVECLNSRLKTLLDNSPSHHFSNEMSFGASRFFDDSISEFGDSMSNYSPSPSSSIGDNESIADYLDSRRRESQCPTPLRSVDTISITSDIFMSSSNCLKNASMRYAIRLLNQSEKVPKHESDRIVITAAVIEAVEILNIICKDDPNIAQKSFVEIERLYKRIEQNPLRARRVYAALVRFINAHNSELMIQLDEVLDVYFRNVPTQLYNNQVACYEMIQFFFDNKEEMCPRVQKYIPSFFKIFSWWVCTFLEEGCEFVDAVTTELNYREVFHLIMDVPCITALLYLKQQGLIEDTARLEVTLNCAWKPYYSAIFAFILRETGGGADTIDKLNELHILLKSLKSQARVKYASAIVSHLLASFFDTLTVINKREVITSMYPLMLERIFLIFPKNEETMHVVEVMADFMREIAKFPGVVAQYHEETIQFFNQYSSTRSSCNGIDNFLSSVVWCISSDCASYAYNQVTEIYSLLETAVYEICFADSTILISQEMVFNFLSSLSKVAAHTQEFIPRAVVCLNKTSGALARYRFIVSYAGELINVLKRPKVVPSILVSHTTEEGWHRRDDVLSKIQYLTQVSQSAANDQ